MRALNDVYLDLDLAPAKPFEVIGFGENAVDWVCSVPMFPLQDSKMRMDSMMRMGGGTIATACAVCARYGLRTRYVGRVGDDEAGQFSRRDLQKEGFDLLLDVMPDTNSHLSLIIVDRVTGKRTILWDRDPKLCYAKGQLQLSKVLDAEFLLLDASDPVASLVVAKEARTAAVQTVLDIDKVSSESEELLSIVSIALPSVSFVRDFAGVSDWKVGLETISEVCSGLVGTTLGEKGAAVIWHKEIVEFPAFPVDVVDSTAAGDVFHGAFVYAIKQGWSLGRSIRFSNVAGALACRQAGARASIPFLEEVYEAVKELHSD